MNIKSIKLGASFWRRLGQTIIQRVRQQAKNGIFQTPSGASNKPNYNKDYAKYKANDMRRFTTGEAKNSVSTFNKAGDVVYKGMYFDNRKAKSAIQRKTDSTHGSGKRLKAYYGESISNRDVSKVNMELTGKTLRGFHVESTTDESVTLGFRSEDAAKVIGNQEKYDRSLIGLNDENLDFVRDEIVKEMNKKIDGILPGNINITIKI